MTKLVGLIVATLAATVVVLLMWGGGSVPVTRSSGPASTDPGAPPLPDPVVVTAAEPAPVVQVEAQTPEIRQPFPGPVLQPSPEYAGRTPPPAETGASATDAGADDGPSMFVTAERVNFREGPSTGDAVIGALARGATVRIMGTEQNGWMNIRDATGRAGFISARFLSATRP